MVNTNKAALADHWQTRFPLPPGPIQDAVGALLEDVVVLVDAPLCAEGLDATRQRGVRAESWSLYRSGDQCVFAGGQRPSVLPSRSAFRHRGMVYRHGSGRDTTRRPLQAGSGGEFSQLDVERACDLSREHQPDVLTASLDAAHVRAVDARRMCERLLREAECQSPFAHGSAERNQFGCLGVAG